MSHRIYFYGEGDALGTVKELPISVFKQLVEQKLNIASTLNVTRQQFLALPKKERDILKRTQYLVPGTYQSSPSKRHVQNVVKCNLIFLDIDEEADGSLPAAPYVSDPSKLYEQLAPYNFAAYTTANSTAEKPRLRIVVEAAELSVHNYKKAVTMIAERIGLPIITKESFNCNQPMYLPLQFNGDTDEHPLIVYRYDGDPVRNEHVVAFNPQVFKDGATPSKEWEDATSGDVLDYLRPVVQDISLDTVSEALGNIDPDCGYQTWLEIAASLRHQFQYENTDEAYQLFDTWSSLGSKYAGTGDTLAKWNSLRPNPKDRAPITVRSLLRLAISSGWSSVKTRQDCFQGTLRWLEDVEDHATLLSDGLGRIISTPLLGHAEEEALLNSIVIHAKNKFQLKISLTTLRKDLQRMKTELDSKNKKKEDSTYPAWTKGRCYVSRTNEFFKHSTVERYTPDSLDSVFGRRLLPDEGEDDDHRPTMRPRDYLLNKVQIPTVYDYVYDPRFPNDTFISLDGRPYVNLYVPNYPEPSSEGVEYVRLKIKEHMENLIGEENYRKIIMDFLAHVVQFPGQKIRWAPLLQGAEGCGKSFLSNLMGAALGTSHMKPIDLTAIKSGYNDWAYGAQLISIEEIKVAGNNRHEIMNMMKPLITNSTININQRYRDSRPVDNTANYLLYTNHHDSLVLSKADRRYFVVKSALQTKDQVKSLGEEYFSELFDMLDTHAPAIRWFFENWTISANFLSNGHAPETHYLRQLINDSASETTSSIREAIEEEVHPWVSEDLMCTTTLKNIFEMKGLRASKQHISTVLREEGFTHCGRVTVDGSRFTFWTHLSSPIDASDVKELAEFRLAEHKQHNPSLL